MFCQIVHKKSIDQVLTKPIENIKKLKKDGINDLDVLCHKVAWNEIKPPY